MGGCGCAESVFGRWLSVLLAIISSSKFNRVIERLSTFIKIFFIRVKTTAEGNCFVNSVNDQMVQ